MGTQFVELTVMGRGVNHGSTKLSINLEFAFEWDKQAGALTTTITRYIIHQDEVDKFDAYFRRYHLGEPGTNGVSEIYKSSEIIADIILYKDMD